MTLFTIYDPTTGTIFRSGWVRQDDDAALQAGAGEAALFGVRGDPATDRVDIEQDPPVVVPQ